jgi:fluoroquinolone transport system permease protein
VRTANTLKFDILFQFRHGFYYAYLFVTVIYVLALLNLPVDLRPIITQLLLFTDTTMLGFFFIGAIVLLEKSQNIHESLFVTPLRIIEYFISKLVSLTLISLLSSLVIVLAVHGRIPNFIIFSGGIALTSCFFTLFGFVFATKARNVNDYFGKALGAGLFFSLPILDLLNVIHSPLFFVFPTQATILILKTPFTEIAPLNIAYALVWLLVWNLIMGRMAYQSFYKHIILKIGGNR